VRAIFTAWGAAAAVLMLMWAPVRDFFVMLWDGIRSGFTVAWEAIVTAATVVFGVLTAVFSPLAEFFSGLWNTVADAFKAAFGWVLDRISWAVNTVRELGQSTVGSLFGEGEKSASQPQVISPQDRAARSISETTTTSRGEVTIKDTTGKAQITKKPKGNLALRLAPSGAF
jgi:phage-related protein